MVDPQGRVVISHGINVIRKTAPYYPPNFDASDARFLAGEGFNGQRIGFIWAGVEPAPDTIDTAYVSRISQLNDTLAAAGMYALVDFHQDTYGAKYGGDGAPDWAAISAPCPSPPDQASSCQKTAMLQAFQNLWDNAPASDGTGLQEHFRAAWKAAATALSGAPNLTGYDLFNEPYAGIQYTASSSAPALALKPGS